VKDLIEALVIFQKYRDCRNPTHCEHDVLTVVGIGDVEHGDKVRLHELGFLRSMEDPDDWISFRFGSA
jgi:hypothetical protein